MKNVYFFFFLGEPSL